MNIGSIRDGSKVPVEVETMHTKTNRKRKY